MADYDTILHPEQFDAMKYVDKKPAARMLLAFFLFNYSVLLCDELDVI